MHHDVKAISNVFYKLARAEKRYLTNLDYQRLVCIAQELSVKVLGEPLFADRIVDSVDGRLVPRLYDALYLQVREGAVRGRLETRTRPIKEESPAWKVCRAAWLQFDVEQAQQKMSA